MSPSAQLIDLNSDDFAPSTAAALREAVTSPTAWPFLFTLTIPLFAGEPKVEMKAIIKDRQHCNGGKVSLELAKPAITAAA